MRRPGHGQVGGLIVGGAQERKDGERSGEIEDDEDASAEKGGAAPERAHALGIDPASPAVLGFGEQRADPAEAGGVAPMGDGIAAGVEGMARVAEDLAGARVAMGPAKAKPGFAGVPVNERPPK